MSDSDIANGPSVVPQPAHLVIDGSSGPNPRDLQTPTGPGAEVVALRMEQLGHSPAKHSGCPVETIADSSIPAEGYRLRVQREHVEITAPDEAGFRHAATTLGQLRDSAPNAMPTTTISDAPRFAWRGAHLDVSRHFFGVDEVERYLELLASLRLNVFHWHLVDDHGWRLEVPALPRLTEVGAWRIENGERYGGFYSTSDVERIVAYARDRGIRVIPEIELPGHSRAALAADPTLSCRGERLAVPTEWGVFEDVYCAGSETVFEFLETVFDEVVRLFPDDTVHVGGDECPVTRWEECPRCQERRAQEGLEKTSDLHGWFIGRAARSLAARGRRIIGWDEILDGPLPDGARVMSWRGTEGATIAARAGHQAVLCPMSHCYLDHQQADRDDELGRIGILPLERIAGWEPLPSELSEADRAAILGLQGNVWTEGIRTREELDHMTLPRLAALAEAAWSPSEVRAESPIIDRLPALLDQLAQRGYGYRALDGAGADLRRTTLEICVDDMESLEIAVRGGADRVEICSRLDLDGLTPEPELINAALKAPVEAIAMIRPRGGDFTCSEEDRRAVIDDIERLVEAGVRAFAFGALTDTGDIDEELARHVVDRSPGPVTFHRAFDLARDRDAALDMLIELGFARVLTSGPGRVAYEHCDAIRHTVERAAGRIEIVAAGGVRAGHAVALVRRTGVPAIHSSARGPDGCDLTIVRALETIAHP